MVGSTVLPDADRGPCEVSIDQAVVGLVVLGVLLRVGHYLTNYPLWGDEAFLAVNFVRRGYLDLLAPLEYGQICPILFLWAELTAVKLFGFSEMSLRLFPLICAVASVFLFHRVAKRVLTGAALIMAMAIFAVSIHPIRHGADAKPYATDLLMSLGLLALAIEWHRWPARTRALWMLIGFTPIAMAASYPAVLVAGGILVALVPSVWKTRRWWPRIALGSFAISIAAAFLAVRAVSIHAQQPGPLMAALQTYWATSFPPLDSPFRLATWLVTTHAGSMFAYPWGGAQGASSGTLILVLIAMVVLWRRGQRTFMSLLVMPMGMGLLAAALRLYPYGVQARIMQYLAPPVCLLAGLGASVLLERLIRPAKRAVAIRIAVTILAVVGIAVLIDGFRHPYRSLYDHQAREFARRFWAEQASDSELACLQWDFGIRQRRTAVARTAIYLCNQHIYSPSRRVSIEPRWSLVTPERPLRCVVFDEAQFNSPEAADWLGSMLQRYQLRKRLDVVVPMTGLDTKPWQDRVFVFEFEPRPIRPPHQIAVGGAGEAISR